VHAAGHHDVAGSGLCWISCGTFLLRAFGALVEGGRAQHVSNFCMALHLRWQKTLRTRGPILLYLASPVVCSCRCGGGSDSPHPRPTPPLCTAGPYTTATITPVTPPTQLLRLLHCTVWALPRLPSPHARYWQPYKEVNFLVNTRALPSSPPASTHAQAWPQMPCRLGAATSKHCYCLQQQAQ
jgi:hypothetical protein